MSQSSAPQVVVIVGATATGKTAVGVELASALGGEVVNGDSRLFYRGMDVATAKPSRGEMRDVPHHLIDFLEPDEPFSLSQYLVKAKSTIDQIVRRKKLPVVVGGSGQYIWALVEGWEVPQVEPDERLRSELEATLEKRGVEALAIQLEEIAPDVAASTDLKNPRRVIRAIERVSSESGVDDHVNRKAKIPPYDCMIIGLESERSLLHKRVTERLDEMLSNGWKQEVETLLKAGYSTDDRSMSGIGYRQMVGHIQGDYGLDEAVRLTTVATNRLIRQQSNWFKKDDPRIKWFDFSPTPDRTIETIVTAVNQWKQVND